MRAILTVSAVAAIMGCGGAEDSEAPPPWEGQEPAPVCVDDGAGGPHCQATVDGPAVWWSCQETWTQDAILGPRDPQCVYQVCRCDLDYAGGAVFCDDYYVKNDECSTVDLRDPEGSAD